MMGGCLHNHTSGRRLLLRSGFHGKEKGVSVAWEIGVWIHGLAKLLALH